MAFAPVGVGVRGVLAGEGWVGEANWSGECGGGELLAALAFWDGDFGDGGGVAGVAVEEHPEGDFGGGDGVWRWWWFGRLFGRACGGIADGRSPEGLVVVAVVGGSTRYD